MWLWVKNQWYHFGVGAPPILESILVVGLGSSLGTIWLLTHGPVIVAPNGKGSSRNLGRSGRDAAAEVGEVHPAGVLEESEGSAGAIARHPEV